MSVKPLKVPGSLMFHLMQLPDPRRHNVVHPLSHVLAQVLVAVAGGANNPQEIEWFCVGHADWFKRVFGIDKTPSHDTVSRVLSVLNYTRLEHVLRSWTRSLLPADLEGVPDIVSLDGKMLNGLASEVNLVSAMSTQHGLVLGSLDTGHAKQNELHTVVALLQQLTLKGTVVVADAASTFPVVVDEIRNQKADYVLAAKGNQKLTAETIQLCFDKPFTTPEVVTQVDAASGHVVTRTYEFIKLGKQPLPFTEKWRDLKGVGKATTRTLNKKTGKESAETRYFMTSLTDAALFADTVRKHWTVESMHWVLDVIFREDACQVRDKNAQKNLNTIRKLVFNAFKKADPKAPISKRRKMGGWNEDALWETTKALFA